MGNESEIFQSASVRICAWHGSLIISVCAYAIVSSLYSPNTQVIPLSLSRRLFVAQFSLFLTTVCERSDSLFFHLADDEMSTKKI